jgi:hypothetical protein
MTTVGLTRQFHDLAHRGRAIAQATMGPEDVHPDRTLWMFWGGELPDHVAACIGKVDLLRGSCPLIVVTPDTARVFAPDMPTTWESLESWAHRSDVLAPHLLHRFGGMYLDADTIAVAPVDDLLTRLSRGDEDFVAFVNSVGEPSVGVMWSRSGSDVTAVYIRLLEDTLAHTDQGTELHWVALGSPMLRDAFRAADCSTAELPRMLGQVATFAWQAWRTLLQPEQPIEPFLRTLPGGGQDLVLAAIYHSRAGHDLAERTEPTLFDSLLHWERPDDLPAENARLSFMVKTFNRPRTVSHAVARLRERFPAHPVVVVDDSDDLYIADLASFGVAHLIIPFDAGLSRGRNIGIRHIDTEYFVMFDDDQFPADDLDLDAVVELMDVERDIDVIGGWEDDSPHVRDSFQLTNHRDLMERRHLPTGRLTAGGRHTYHMVQNQTLWRTEVVRARKLRWADHLKVGEHVDFFFRYRDQLTIVFIDHFHFSNVPSHLRDMDAAVTDYARFRNRQRTMWKRAKQRNDLDSITVTAADMPPFDFETNPLRYILRAGSRLVRQRLIH